WASSRGSQPSWAAVSKAGNGPGGASSHALRRTAKCALRRIKMRAPQDEVTVVSRALKAQGKRSLREGKGADEFVAPLCAGAVPAWSGGAPRGPFGDRQFRARRRPVRGTRAVRANH